MQVRIHLMLRNSLMVAFLHSRSNGERGALASPCALSTFLGTRTGSGAGAVGRMISKERKRCPHILSLTCKKN